MVLFLIFLSLLSVVTAFGATYILLRKSAYATYSALLALVFFQPLLLVTITLLGYRKPIPLHPAFVFAPVAAGICLTLFAVLRYRGEIVDALREEWKASALISLLAVTAMAFATPILTGSASLGYIDWRNEELTNYALLAHYFLGIVHNPNFVSFCEQNFELRYGAELFLAAFSALTGKAPLLLVEVLSAFHKISAIVAFAISFELIRKGRNVRPLAAVAADIGFACSAILSLNHVLPFLAAQAVTGSFILITLGLFSVGIKRRRVQIFLAIQLLFVVITYSEVLPFLCVAAAVIFIEAYFTRRKDTAIAILSIFAAGLLINPMLLAQRLKWMYALRSMMAGYNVIGSPKENLLNYLAAALGFHYSYVNVPPIQRALLAVATFLALATVACAFVAAAYELKTLLFLVIPAILILVHFTNDQPLSLAYYKSYKTIAALYFYIFLSTGFLIGWFLRRPPGRGPFQVLRVVLLSGAGVLIVGNLFVSYRAVEWIKTVPTVYYEGDFQRALSPPGKTDEGRLILSHDNSASIWYLMANFLNLKFRMLDVQQAVIVYRNHSPIFVDTDRPVFSDSAAGQGSSPVFKGGVIVPTVADYPPESGPELFNVRAMLESISPGVRLIEGETLLQTPAFRLVNGTLVRTGDPSAAVDGKTNLPPAIDGVTPQSGQGTGTTFNFIFSDPNGSADVLASLILIHSEERPAPYECYISFSFETKLLGLVLDGGTAWGSAPMGSTQALENRNCAVGVDRSSVTASGNEVTLHLPMKFKSAFSGRKIIEATVFDLAKVSAGPRPVGFWTVP